MANPEKDAAHTAKVQFHYIKAPDYREIACHGALGGPTPSKLVWMSLFTERGAIPRVVEYDIAGEPGQEVMLDEGATTPSSVETRSGIVRNVQISAYLDLDAAKRIHKWLGQQIAQLEASK